MGILSLATDAQHNVYARVHASSVRQESTKRWREVLFVLIVQKANIQLPWERADLPHAWHAQQTPSHLRGAQPWQTALAAQAHRVTLLQELALNVWQESLKQHRERLFAAIAEQASILHQWEPQQMPPAWSARRTLLLQREAQLWLPALAISAHRDLMEDHARRV
jgi:hypothetical protein